MDNIKVFLENLDAALKRENLDISQHYDNGLISDTYGAFQSYVIEYPNSGFISWINYMQRDEIKYFQRGYKGILAEYIKYYK